MYPTFLQKAMHLSASTASWVAVLYNLGAIIGGMAFGSFSESRMAAPATS